MQATHNCVDSSKKIPFVSTYSPTKKFLHDNPLALKVTLCFFTCLGLVMAYSGLSNGNYYQLFTGLQLTIGSVLAYAAAPFFIPPTHNPFDKAFQETCCRGVHLVYKGNLPLLIIPKEVSSYDAGYARGFMMAPQIKKMIGLNNFAFCTLMGFPKEIPLVTEKMKSIIPEKYLAEMQGLVDGYNKKRESWNFLKGDPLTLEWLIYFHMLPDMGSMDYKNAEIWLKRQKEAMGCTVVMDGDEEDGPTVLRTVDWNSMGIFGSVSFVELRETSFGIRTINQSCPLLVGYLTALNEKGLFGSLNVAIGMTDYPEKMPIVFYLRHLIECCEDVEDALRFCQEKALSSSNLCFADKQNGRSVHLMQLPNGSNNEREWDKKKPLVTLNFRYAPTKTRPTPTNSWERESEIHNKYRKFHGENMLNARERLLKIRSGREVNNPRTISTAIIKPDESFSISFDNGYAGSKKLMKVPLKIWFGRDLNIKTYDDSKMKN